MKTQRTLWTTLIATMAIGCGGAPDVLDYSTSGDSGNKEDSGWLGSDTFEVQAEFSGVVFVEAAGDWAEVATDSELQTKLVDLQLMFAKTTAEAKGWRLNQLADSVEITRIEETEDGVAVHYNATTDLLGKYRGFIPDIADLETRFSAPVPVWPAGFKSSVMAACSEVDGGHSVRDYNFHYYFAPNKEGCELQTAALIIEITEVFDRPVVYPEYDQLMQQLDGETLGFRAALVPNRGDDDPLSRFNVHAKMLEQELGLTGVDSEDGTYRQYTYKRGGVAIIIDLYDPSDVPWTTGFDGHFRERLGDYTLIHYNGHSSYGSKNLLNNPESFSDAYQIISVHSCQSYAYYTRQVFRAKATDNDPTGHATADVLATGKSSYPSGAPPTIETLLKSLLDGMAAISDGNPQSAPDWLTISKRVTSSTWGDIMYGMAGVRSNRWQPTAL